MSDPTIDSPAVSAHHRVLVIGGGNGGISVAARLQRRGVDDWNLILRGRV